MVRGKQKGNAFENLIYKDLRDNHKGIVSKSLGSGNTDEPADILFITRWDWKFAIECKHYKSLSYQKLEEFYDKTAKDIVKKSGDRTPVVVYRVNNGPIMCYLRYHRVKCIMKYIDWKREINA